MAHDVFISYSAKDKTIADGVCATLENNGIRCWIAPRDILPGTEYAEALVEAIQSSRLLVLVFSSRSNDSVQVRQEVERAVSHGLPILPFRIEDVPPSRAMELFISARHWLDALTPPLESHLLELARTTKLLLSRPSDPTKPPPHVVAAPSASVPAAPGTTPGQQVQLSAEVLVPPPDAAPGRSPSPGLHQTADRLGAAQFQPQPPQPQLRYPPRSPFVIPPRPRKDEYAITALVLGLASFIPFVGVVAIVLAIRAKNRIKQSRGAVAGDGLAMAGLILGIVGCAFYLLALVGMIIGDTPKSHSDATLPDNNSQVSRQPPAVSLDSTVPDGLSGVHIAPRWT